MRRVGQVNVEFKIKELTSDPSPAKTNSAWVRNSTGIYQFSYATIGGGNRRFTMA